jgi:hypothetical protein
MAKHRKVLPPQFLVGDGTFVHGMVLKLFWSLIGALENRCCQFADHVELLASFERHEELIVRRFDEPIVSEDAIF